MLDGHPAAAWNGPLAGDEHLRVENGDHQGRWPTPVVWSSGGERHVYELMALAVGTDLVSAPVYVFLETLSPGESPPEVGWILPHHYLM